MAIDQEEHHQLTRHNVTVKPFVDQWSILAASDLFVTHHGMHSTHEAIFHGVPMLSCPLFSDQPALAERCQQLHLALPLAPAPSQAPTVQEVGRTIAEASTRRHQMRASLERARRWELSTLAARGDVLHRLLDLACAGAQAPCRSAPSTSR
jgi:UDP:flavonoid glycosyltransferase YjiC (YdhE family)